MLIVSDTTPIITLMKMGLPITGTIGLLLKAFDEGMLTAGNIEECIEKLKETNVRISEGLFDIMREHIKE